MIFIPHAKNVLAAYITCYCIHIMRTKKCSRIRKILSSCVQIKCIDVKIFKDRFCIGKFGLSEQKRTTYIFILYSMPNIFSILITLQCFKIMRYMQIVTLRKRFVDGQCNENNTSLFWLLQDV